MRFGYRGQHTAGFSDDISIEAVHWFLGYLDQVSEDQMRQGLRASGATPEQEECFTAELLERIRQLRKAATGARSEPETDKTAALHGGRR